MLQESLNMFCVGQEDMKSVLRNAEREQLCFCCVRDTFLQNCLNTYRLNKITHVLVFLRLDWEQLYQKVTLKPLPANLEKSCRNQRLLRVPKRFFCRHRDKPISCSTLAPPTSVVHRLLRQVWNVKDMYTCKTKMCMHYFSCANITQFYFLWWLNTCKNNVVQKMWQICEELEKSLTGSNGNTKRETPAERNAICVVL